MIKPSKYLHVYNRKIKCQHCPCKANSVCNGKGFYWGDFGNIFWAFPNVNRMQIISDFYTRSLHELIEEILGDSID
jgi:hypothetical protein